MVASLGMGTELPQESRNPQRDFGCGGRREVEERESRGTLVGGVQGRPDEEEVGDLHLPDRAHPALDSDQERERGWSHRTDGASTERSLC